MNTNMFYLDGVLFTVEDILVNAITPTLIVRAAPTSMENAKAKILKMVSRYGAEFRLRVQRMFDFNWVIACDLPEIYQEDSNPFEYILEFSVMPESDNRNIIVNRFRTMEKGFNGPSKLDVGLQEGDISLVSTTYIDDARHGKINMPDGVTTISFPISLYRLEKDNPEIFSRIMTGVMNILRSDIQRTRPLLTGFDLKLYYAISVTSDTETSKVDIYWVITGINDTAYDKINYEFMMYRRGNTIYAKYPKLDQIVNGERRTAIYTDSDLYTALYSDTTTGYYVIPSYSQGYRTMNPRPDGDDNFNYSIKPVQLCLVTKVHLNGAIAVDFNEYDCHEDDTVCFYERTSNDCDYFNYVGTVDYTVSDDYRFIVDREDVKYILDHCGTLDLDVILVDRWNQRILFGVTEMVEQHPDGDNEEDDENEIPAEQTDEIIETVHEEDKQLPAVIDSIPDQTSETEEFKKFSKERKSEIIKDVIAKMFGGDKK